MHNFNYYKYEILFECSDGKRYHANGNVFTSNIDKAWRSVSEKYTDKVLSLTVRRVELSIPVNYITEFYGISNVRETRREECIYNNAMEEEI